MAHNSALQETPLSFKIILLGDSGVGKTCFLKQFIDHEYIGNSKPTINIDFATRNLQVDQFSIRLNVFDTAGQQRFFSLTKSYLKGVDAALFMYDMHNKQSLMNINKWVAYFEKQSQCKEELRVLVGTKKDLLDDIDATSSQSKNQNQFTKHKKTEHFISKEQIVKVLQKNKMVFKFQTSAKTNKNIGLVFEEISRNLIYNSVKRKKQQHSICQNQWSTILKRDKEHLRRQQDKNKKCC